MLNWWQALILGVVQGFTEFLPVSSSGHLILTREFMGLSGASYLSFDILLHAATLVAVCFVLFKDIVQLFKPPFKMLGLLALASVPAVITGLIVALSGADEIFESPKYLCFFFLATAGLMLASELISKRNRRNAENAALKTAESEKTEAAAENAEHAENAGQAGKEVPFKDFKLKNAVGMGLAQMFAPFPGLSRSGSTLFGGIVTKGKREDVAKFSFLMSIPIILGSVVIALYQLIKPDVTAAAVIVPWYCYLLGMAAAAATGFLAIKVMLRIIAKADYKWFALYLVALSIFTFIRYFLGV